MAHTGLHPDCPSLPSLVGWVEGTLGGAEATRIEQHLHGCGSCRRRALDWSEQLDSAQADAETPADCIDAEMLVAYCAAEGEQDSAAAAQLEGHLQQCARCVSTLQHFVRMQRQLGASESAVAAAAAPTAEMARKRPRAISAAPTWWQRLGDLLTPRIWTGAALAAAMALIAAIGISRFLSPSGPYEGMRVRNAPQAVTAQVTTDTVGRPRPSADEPVLVELSRGTQARWLETSGDWTRIELEDGRRVWVDSTAVARLRTE